MRKSVILTLALLCFMLSGCAETQVQKNNDALLQLEMGMSKDQVISVMGKPSLNEAYQSLNGKAVVIYRYVTQLAFPPRSTIHREDTTPVVFENGKLVGWGAEFYKHKLEIDVNIKNN
ncbi:MAG: DUF3192 domain-containing protein [Desulfobacteraceae bacterium]|nr:DUF3192 domain-containing protein [Desulfobacteraceae bacterium]